MRLLGVEKKEQKRFYSPQQGSRERFVLLFHTVLLLHTVLLHRHTADASSPSVKVSFPVLEVANPAE